MDVSGADTWQTDLLHSYAFVVRTLPDGTKHSAHLLSLMTIGTVIRLQRLTRCLRIFYAPNCYRSAAYLVRSWPFTALSEYKLRYYCTALYTKFYLRTKLTVPDATFQFSASSKLPSK